MSAADPPPAAVQRSWGVGHAAVGLLLSLVANAVFAVLALEVGGYESPDELPLWLVALLQVPLWTGLLGVPLWLNRRRGVTWSADLGLSFRRSDAWSGLAIGVAAQAVLVPMLYLPLFVLTDQLDVSEPARRLVEKADGAGVALLFVVVAVGAPLVEEVFFRGLVLRAFTDRWRRGVALVASAVVFGAIHFQPLQFPALFMFGLIAGGIAMRDGRLGRAVWAHVGFNAWTVGVLLWA